MKPIEFTRLLESHWNNVQNNHSNDLIIYFRKKHFYNLTGPLAIQTKINPILAMETPFFNFATGVQNYEKNQS